jgi:hypothetical protein
MLPDILCTTVKRLELKAEKLLSSSMGDYPPWLEHKSVYPTVAYNIEIDVTNNFCKFPS